LISTEDLRFVHGTLGALNDRVAEFDWLDRLKRLPEEIAKARAAMLEAYSQALTVGAPVLPAQGSR
jgi:hypothetical protein